MSVFSFKQRNNLVLVVLVFLGLLILFSLRAYITSFLGAIVLYVLFKPMYLFCCKKLSKSLSSVLIIILSFIIIVIPFFVLGYMITNKVIALREDTFQLKAILYKINDFVGIHLNQPKLLDRYLEKLTALVQEFFPSFLGGAFDVFLSVILMYFMLYFMFVQSEGFEKVLIKYAPLREHHARQFAEELKNTTYSNILGQGIIAIIQGSLVSLAFFIAGLDDAVFWGIIGVFLSFMPVIGAPMVTLPAAVILYLNGDHYNAIFILLFTLIILINIDNVIRFMINKRIADTHPIVTVIGVVLGIPLFGFVGIVFGPLLLLWFIHLIAIYEEDIKTESRLN